jgi:hypothetical protein
MARRLRKSAVPNARILPRRQPRLRKNSKHTPPQNSSNQSFSDAAYIDS